MPIEVSTGTGTGIKNLPGVFKSLEMRAREEFDDLLSYLRLLSRKELKLEPYSCESFGQMVSFDGMDGFTEVERYYLNQPYALVSILLNEKTKEYLYYVVEPELSAFERMMLETVYDNILDTLTIHDISDQGKSEILERKTLDLLDSYAIEIYMVAIYKILYYIKRDYLGYEIIDALMHDADIEDISCDGSDIPIFLYHRKYQNIKTNLSFEEERLDSFVIKLAQRCGKHISIGEPLVNSSLPDGSRLNASLGKEITFRGSSFTIRRFREFAFTPADLIKNGTYSPEILAYLWLAVENDKNIIFSGATAAGKTSSLNAVSLFIPPMAKIVSIEDTHELMLHHTNWVGSIVRESFIKTASVRDIDMFELLRQALRQRPEYIIVGEIRGKEALTLFQAMNTGHTTFSTMHADSVNTVISRLEGEPLNVPRVMMQALNIICIQKLIQIGHERVRRLDMLIELVGIDQQTNDLRFNIIYKWNPENDTIKKEGKSFVLEDIMIRRNWDENTLKLELENRQRILEFMSGMDEHDIVSLIQSYYIEPERTMKVIKKDKRQRRPKRKIKSERHE